MKKRVISFLLALAMMLTMMPVAQVIAVRRATSGVCGENLTWNFSDDGILTISGIGAMFDFLFPDTTPWEYAFIRGEITTLVIEQGVTSIGEWAFGSCVNLQNVSIPDSVTSIGECAFWGCSSLLSLAIPESVTSIGSGAFDGCSSITGFWVDENNPCYSSDSHGVLFDKEQTTLLQAPDTLSGAYKIPNSVSSIGDGAFYECSGLTSVDIPDGVTSIGEFAFDSCFSLQSISLPEKITSISNYTFQYCIGLQSVHFSGNVTSIGYGAFNVCEALTDIYYGGTAKQWEQIVIDEFGNSPLTVATIHTVEPTLTEISITAPTKTEYAYGEELDTTGMVVTAIYSDGSTAEVTEGYEITGYYACDAGVQTVTVTYGGASAVFTVRVWGVIGSGTCGENLVWRLGEDGMLFISGTGDMYHYGYNAMGAQPWEAYCKDIVSVVIEAGVTGIGDQAFYYCENLQSATIPEGIAAIGNYAFYNCSNLTGVELPESLELVGSWSFYNCTGLTGIVIPSAVKTIGYAAFKNCLGLKSVTVSEGLQTLSESAFSGCHNLSGINIPSTVTHIGKYAFLNCDQMDGVWVDENNADYCSDEYGFLYTKDMTRLLQANPAMTGRYDTAKTLQHIDDYAFQYCKGITAISFPNTLKSVGDFAFYACGARTVYYDGTAKQWKANVSISHYGVGNNLLLYDAQFHFVEVSGITVTSPDTLVYRTGEALDTTGMVVTATYENGYTEEITEGYTIEGYDANTPGEQTVTVNYEGFTATFCVSVREKILYGDVNGDGSVDTRDRAILTRYLADWEGYADQIDLKAADVNGDGAVDTRDRAILTRYLADWETYPELPYTG